MNEKDRTPRKEDGDASRASDDEASDEALSSQEVQIRALLRRGHLDARTPQVDLLSGVQRRIRERSRGRFFADGWSTGRVATSTYVVTSLLMLVILSIVYYVLVPSLPPPR